MKRMTAIAAIILAATLPIEAQSQADENNPDTQDIVEALLPLDLSGRRVKGARSLDAALDNSRGVTVFEGREVPYINLRVAFAYDSDELTNDALLTLDKLATALGNPALKESRFRIVGHTDARGSDSYNQDLSERRAIRVVSYLADRHGLDPAMFNTSGAGESRLLDGVIPEDERNRRVEVQNIGDKPGQ